MPSDQPTRITTHSQLHDRLELWRRRERIRYPALFLDSLSPLSEPTPTVSLQTLRSGRARLLINGTAILLCDACSALLPAGEPDHAASSASTLPPQTPLQESWIICTVCAFPTPLGHLRRLLNLPDDRGPHFPPDVARALLIEAIGAPKSVTLKDPSLRAWILDRDCRMAGLDALCVVLGICDEQLVDPTNNHPTPSFDVHAMRAAERFLDVTMPQHVMPRLPFTVTQLCQHVVDAHSVPSRAARAREATERANSLLKEALRIWSDAQNVQASENPGFASVLVKLRALGREYVTEQTKVRRYNHSELHAPKHIQVTQSERPKSNQSKETSK